MDYLHGLDRVTATTRAGVHTRQWVIWAVIGCMWVIVFGFIGLALGFYVTTVVIPRSWEVRCAVLFHWTKPPPTVGARPPCPTLAPGPALATKRGARGINKGETARAQCAHCGKD